MADTLHTVHLASPLGTIIITASDVALHALIIAPSQPVGTAQVSAAHPLLDETARQLGQYFAGTRQQFGLPLVPLRSDRGKALRAGICSVGYGATQSYGMLARRLESGARAVGQACRRNPLPIIVPCHRIVSAQGPEHYSGGDGVATKAWLLAHEARHSQS